MPFDVGRSLWYVDRAKHPITASDQVHIERLKEFSSSNSKTELKLDTTSFFKFDPNNIGEEEWMLLGFSEKQADKLQR